MSGRVPVKSSDCRECFSGVQPCSYHPARQDYRGHEAYSPSEWVLSVVGKQYRGPFGECLYECTGYDIRAGFWMKDVATGEVRSVSERAIGRTFHVISD